MLQPVNLKRCVVSLFVSLVVLCSPAFAQLQSGRIVGTVFDPNHATIPGAKITVTNTGTNQSTTVTTNDVGDFVVTPLDPGIYKVSVTASGFQTAVVNDVEVVVGQSSRVEVQARLGETETRVEVTAKAPLLNTESGSLGQLVTSTQIADLPLNGRSYYELARLAPGAVMLPPSTSNLSRIRANYQSGMTVSGIKGAQTTFLLDGVDVTDHLQGGTLIQTSIDALQEFQMQQGEYSAEFPSAGGVLNVTTKMGTAQFHGVLFDFLRNDKFDSRNFFAVRRDILKRNQFGAAIGGPLSIPHVYESKGKTFFYISYEGMRQRAGQVFNDIVPSVAMKGGDFSGAGLNTIYDPLSRTPFAGNTIPESRMSPQALFFSQYIPNPNTSGGTAVFAPSQPFNTDQFTIRVDRNITDSHRVFVRWSFHNNDLSDPNSFPALGSAALSTRGQNIVAALSSTVRPTLINEFRLSFLPNTVNLQPYLPGTDFYKEAGITGFAGTGLVTGLPVLAGSFPDFGWSGYASMNGSAFDQRPKIQDLRVRPEVTDSVTWVKGRNIFKFGVRIKYWEALFSDGGTYQGVWSFNGSMTQNSASPAHTGDAFADYLLGQPYSVARGYRGDWAGGYATYWHFYAQDDFKVNERLTLNLGLRYEYSPFMAGYRGQVGAFDGTLAKPIIVGGSGSQPDLGAQTSAPATYALFGYLIQTTSQAGLPYSVTYPDKNQWAPRFGLAWRPFGAKTVVRGGYGIFYEIEIPGDRVNRYMVPFRCDETVYNSGALTMADYFQGRAIGSQGTYPTLGPTFPHMRMGNDQHWNFGVQQDLGHSSVLEVNYVGTRGSNLLGADTTNIPSAGPGAIQSRRPYPIFGVITYQAQDVSSTYHALQVKYEKRYTAGSWYLVSYTFSKSLTNQQTAVVGGDYAWERALSSFDVPHNLAVSAGYQLPIGNGKKWLSKAGPLSQAFLGGWQFQGIFVARSGLPFTPTISRDMSNTGLGGQRPNRVGSGQLTNPTVNNWFDKTAFSLPPQYTYGNSGGDILRGPRLLNLDFSIFKQFYVTERNRLEFRAEAFNLTNTPSFNTPSTTIDTASGGRITSTATNPRQLQFALKYNF